MLLNNRPRSPSPSASSHASYEHEITALEDQVLTLEGDLVSAKVDLAVQEFDLLGLQHDNYRLQLEHAHATTVADAALAALQAQYQQALRTIQDQEQTIRRQANDLDECQAWILRHNELAQSKPHQTNDSAISGELEALEGLGCVTQSVWSSRFQSSLGRQSTWKQQQLALAQVDAMHVHVGECVHAHSLRVAEAVQVEHALLKAAVTPADGGTNLLPANATVISATQLNVKDESSQANGRTNQGQANIPLTTFDQVAVELGVLVGRYGHVQAS
ncbi:hypothetical protein DYB25_008596 [Aphanomyces astaci]|uniref:Uncharacterized protein n=1 Tax=Aphanomyces astaci TaxID=112090 RepID=A0A397BUJ5_APHAT|nr:hypothetical protein DYB25_008596 [Aphanomyces astaci]